MGWFEDNGYVPSNGNGGVAGGRPYQVAGRPAQGPAPITAQNVDSISRTDPRFNSPEYIAALNAAHPEYSGKPANAPAPSGPAQVGHNGVYNGMNREQYRDAWEGLGNMTPQAADAWLTAHGATQAGGKGDRWTTPYGETLDLQEGRGGANDHGGTIRPIWGAGGGPAAAPRGGPGDGAAHPTSPFGFGGGGGAPAAPVSTVGQSGHLAGSFAPFTYQDYEAPDPFTAPTLAQAQQDPGFAFGLNQGLDAISNRATAQGIRGGDVLKNFNNYANDYASTKYSDVYNRARDAYSLNAGTGFQANQANNSGRLGAFTANTNADLGYGNLANAVQGTSNAFALGQGGLALGNRQADQSYDLGLRNNALGYTQAGNSFALGQGNLGLGWANYGLGANQQQFFQDYQFPISTGFNAAQTTGGYGSNYAQNAAQNAGAVGNAQAAGAVGAGNAWGTALGNIGNAAMGGYYANQYHG